VDTVSKSNRELIDQALTRLPYDATREERRRAMDAARAAIEDCRPEAGEAEKLAAATETVEEIARQVRCRKRLDKWVDLATWLFPLGTGATDGDKEQARAMMEKTLDSLPDDVSDWEIREKLERALKPLRDEIGERNRIAKRDEESATEVSIYLRELRDSGEISQEDYSDLLFDLDDLKELVREQLKKELTGDEEAGEVRDLVRDILDDEIFEDEE
jgi:hypothetical protein